MNKITQADDPDGYYITPFGVRQVILENVKEH